MNNLTKDKTADLLLTSSSLCSMHSFFIDLQYAYYISL